MPIPHSIVIASAVDSAQMIPVGYMAKRIGPKPPWLNAPGVVDIYSVSSSSSEDFADYIPLWKHNAYWLFDSPAILQCVAQKNSISLAGATLFYYEAHERELAEQGWRTFSPDASIPTNILLPAQKQLEGFDVVTFTAGNSPEDSPLSCNGLAEDLPVNSHCLLNSFAEAESYLNSGRLTAASPAPIASSPSTPSPGLKHTSPDPRLLLPTPYSLAPVPSTDPATANTAPDRSHTVPPPPPPCA